MNNKEENVFTEADFLDTLPIRALEELAYQLGVSVESTPKNMGETIIEDDNSYKDELKSAVKKGLNVDSIGKLAQKYFLPSDTPLKTLLDILKNDVVSQLHSINWWSIDDYEKKANHPRIRLPGIDTDAISLPYVSFFNGLHERGREAFAEAFISFFNRLPERGREAFAEAFGVDMDSLRFCFNDAGLAFLQKKYDLPDATFSDFSFTFEHALGAQIPAKESWDWIKGFEAIRGRDIHAKGSFFKPQPHCPKEIRSVAGVSNVTGAESAVISGMSQPLVERTKPHEL